MSLINEEEIKKLVNDSATEWLNSNQNSVKEKFESIDQYVEKTKERVQEIETKIIDGLEEDFEKKKERIEKRLNRNLVGLTVITVLLIAGISGTVLFNTISKTQESTIQLYDKIESFNEKVEESKVKLQASLNNIEAKSKELDSLNKEYKQKVDQLNLLIRAVTIQLAKIELEEKRKSNAP